MGFEKIFEGFERKMAKRRIGSQQVAIGKIRSRFSEKFLGQFDEQHRNEIEALIRAAYQFDDFKRFRSHMILALAISYNNGAIAAAKGTSVDVLKMVKETANEIEEETLDQLSKKSKK